MADWLLFDVDPLTRRKKYMKLEDGLLHIRETMPVDEVLEANKRDANDWQGNGGWKAARRGAVVARVPLILDNAWKTASGYDPAKGGGYDRDKYNTFLDDIDYRHIRTGGGRIGKRKAFI
ncbi:MAG: hypothetical protein K2P94_18015 [Rhodospirillaceae bacterium]|nr:hypothetical protein [Rhodospirillaceae bacterium]